jgi:hypothetical protein
LLALPVLSDSAHAAGLILEKDYERSTSAYKVVPFTTEGGHTGFKSYFTDANGKVLSIDNSLIAEIVRFSNPQNITDQSSVASLRNRKAELEAVAAKVTSTKPYIVPQIAAIENQIARFQSGERMINGKWLTGPEYQKFQADAAAADAAAKAQEEKRIAEQKAAEEKRLAEQNAAEERQRAEQKALEEKRAEEEKAAERDRAEKERNAKADLERSNEQFEMAEKRAAESYKSSSKGTLSGQVFVSTKGGESVKLGAVQISLFARDATDILLAGLKKYADFKIQQAGASLEVVKAGREQADAYAREAAAQERAAFAIYLKSIRTNDSAAAKQAHDAAKEAANNAREAASNASSQYFKIIGNVDFYYSGAFYFGYLRSPIQTAETDADGKFVIEIPPVGQFVIAARGERRVWENTERYYWLQPVSLESKQQRIQNLSNNNLTSATGTSSLILTLDSH